MNPQKVADYVNLMREKLSDENIHKMMDEAEERSPSLDGQIKDIPERPGDRGR